MSVNVETKSTHSLASSVQTRREKTDTAPEGHGESALPEDKLQEAFKNLADDWESSPDNARNWSKRKKWTATAIVIALSCLFPTRIFELNIFSFLTGVVLHICFPTGQFNDGTRLTRDCNKI